MPMVAPTMTPTSTAASRMIRVLFFLGAGSGRLPGLPDGGTAPERWRRVGPPGGCEGSRERPAGEVGGLNCPSGALGGLVGAFAGDGGLLGDADDGEGGLVRAVEGCAGPAGGWEDGGRADDRWPEGWNLAPQYPQEVAWGANGRPQFGHGLACITGFPLVNGERSGTCALFNLKYSAGVKRAYAVLTGRRHCPA